jgi:hypothetical protein
MNLRKESPNYDSDDHQVKFTWYEPTDFHWRYKTDDS